MRKQPKERKHKGGSSVFLRKKEEIVTTKGNIHSKGLLVQIKEEEVYKIITNKAFIDHEDSPFEKIGPHKKFNTQWGTVYSRDLAEFKNEEIM